MLDYIIWNVQPEIIDGFRVRWYGLFFAIGFYVSYTVLGKIFKKEGLQQKELDSFTFLTFILLIAGLRLGHCLFYEPAEYLANPIRILYVWEGGLASHGGVLGLLLSFYIFTRKSGKSFLWIASRAAVVIPFTATCVRLGNLMNSEIYGIATTLPWGFSFLQDTVIASTPEFFSNMLINGGLVATDMQNILVSFLTQHSELLSKGISFNELQEALIQSKFITMQQSDEYVKLCIENKLVTTNHPSQIYEALVYISVFGYLVWYYFSRMAKQKNISSTYILGVTFTVIFTARFLIEFIKNDQVGFEQTMALNMGQILSLPFIILGIYLFYLHVKERKVV